MDNTKSEGFTQSELCAKCQKIRSLLIGRLRVLRPQNKHWKEVNLLLLIADYLEDIELKDKILKLRQEILHGNRRKKIRDIENAGYKVEKIS